VRKAPEVHSGSLARELGGQIGTCYRFFCRSAHLTMVPWTNPGVLWLLTPREWARPLNKEWVVNGTFCQVSSLGEPGSRSRYIKIHSC